MKLKVIAFAIGFALFGAAPTTSVTITVTPAATPSSITPLASDSVAGMVGADTHFNTSYVSYSAATVKSQLTGSNIRHVRDGNPYPIPANIGNGIALGIPYDSAYNKGGNGSFSESECTVAAKLVSGTPGSSQVTSSCPNPNGSGNENIKNNPNADYIEPCGNEEDNDSNIVGGYANSFKMLADCVTEEVGWINSNNLNTRHLPIASPALIKIDHSPEFADALAAEPGGSKNLIDVANFHPGTGSFNPGLLTSCTNTSIVTSGTGTGFPNCEVTYTNKTVMQVAAMYAPLISKTGSYYVTEFGFSDRKNTALDSTGHVSSHIYNRVNGIPESQIAAYDPRSILMWANSGAARMYVYQFADLPTDCTFGAQGLITENLTQFPPPAFQDDTCSGTYTAANSVTVKPEFNAVNNLIALFADAGSTYTPGSISMTVSTSANARSLVAEKRNGTILVALWREENDYDWYGAQSCPLGSSYAMPKNDYPTVNHVYQCQVTTESASVSIPGHTLTRKDVFQADGSITYSTTGLSSGLSLNTPYVTVLEFTPS